MKIGLLLFSLCLFVAAPLRLTADDWGLKTPATRPEARYGHSMASMRNGEVLLVGGSTTIRNDETWLYDIDENSWTLKNPVVRPSARQNLATAYLSDDQVLLFGGDDGTFNNETWVYDLSDDAWTLKNPTTSPSGRYYHSMAPLGNGKVLLFGGLTPSQSDETWVYDLTLNTWTLIAPATGPSARFFHSMASIGSGQAILFGGFTGESGNDETWIFNLSDNTWTLKALSTKPSARYYHQMASMGDDQVLMFGGFDVSFNDETWVYDLSENIWTMRSPATRPTGRVAHALASGSNGGVVLFGGGTPDLSDDTWTYTIEQQITITCPADTVVQNIPNTCSQSVPFVVTASGIPTPTVECKVGNDVIISPHLFPAGTTVVNCTATNTGGSVNCSFTVTVQDTQRPAITSQRNISVRPTSLAGTIVHYQMPVSTDNCSAIVTQTAGLPSGSRFPIGTTTNRFVATDPAGNTATSSFKVKVVNPFCSPHMVRVCHRGRTMRVSLFAAVLHLAHGDLLGRCSRWGNGKASEGDEYAYVEDEDGEEYTDEGVPDQVSMDQNYPNPFNPTTSFNYALPADAHVNLTVYNTLGQEVAQVVDGWESAGYHTVTFDASALSSGVYFYRIRTQDVEGKPFVKMDRMLLMK